MEQNSMSALHRIKMNSGTTIVQQDVDMCSVQKQPKTGTKKLVMIWQPK
jgi:hypothetical protein